MTDIEKREEECAVLDEHRIAWLKSKISSLQAELSGLYTELYRLRCERSGFTQSKEFFHKGKRYRVNRVAFFEDDRIFLVEAYQAKKNGEFSVLTKKIYGSEIEREKVA